MDFKYLKAGIKSNIFSYQISILLVSLFSIYNIFEQKNYFYLWHFRNTKLEDRICTLCNMNDVESEIHFLFDCPCYVNIRQTWLEHIVECCGKFNNLNVEEKLRLLFDQFHRCTAKFILNCFKIRKELLFQ